jgi:hypothetical protein
MLGVWRHIDVDNQLTFLGIGNIETNLFRMITETMRSRLQKQLCNIKNQTNNKPFSVAMNVISAWQ